GAYIALDPTYPGERIQYILEQSQALFVLTTSHLASLVPADLPRVICLDRDWGAIGSQLADERYNGVSPDNLAYIIYTSGSTGRPKGAMNTHRGIVNRLLWMQQTFTLTAEDRVLQKTPTTFDVSIWELFWPLMAGSTLVLAAPNQHREAPYI